MRRALLALATMLAAMTSAPAGETLTVLTYESFVAEWGPGPAIETAFEAECGCDLAWVAVPDGVAILNRLKLEGAASQADVVLGLDNNLVVEAAATGLFATLPADLPTPQLPVGWTNDRFLPFDYAHFAVVYDSERLATPPRSLADLVEGGDGKIVLQDPRTSTPGLGFLLWMKAVYGAKAADAWRQLKPRVLTVTPGWSEAYALMASGEAPMVMSYATSPAYHRITEGSQRYRAAIFAEGHPLQIEVVGVLEASANRKLAERFLRFVPTPAFQDTIPTGNWMLPAGPTSTPMPSAFDDARSGIASLDVSPETVAAERRAWTDEWLAAMGR
jgi:thiamine transport system substrate-binding protein